MNRTPTPPLLPATEPAEGAVRWAGLLRCELIKLTSLRAMRWTLVALGVLIVGAGVAITAGSTTGARPADVRPGDIAAAFSIPLSGTVLARGLVAAFGVVAATGDLGTGMTRTTLMAAPRRGRLLLAKAGVVALLSGGVCTPAVIMVWLIGNARLSHHGLNFPVANSHAWLALAGNVAVLVGLALAGLATGVLMRSAAAAICAVLGAILVVPVILLLLPAGELTDVLNRWWLTETITNTVDVVDHTAALPGGAGLLAFSAWLVLLGAAAAASFTSRTP
jgi:ABC-2 type transport system permease protein